MRILVCDDDIGFASLLAKRLGALSEEWQISAQLHCEKNAALLDEPALSAVDIAFLDIDMGEVNGIELARRLRKFSPDCIILFVTNYIEYAPSGYEVQAFRYLVKARWEEKLPSYFRAACEEYAKKQRSLAIQIGSEIIRLPIQDILYFESCGRKIQVHMQNDRRAVYEFYATMAAMTERLEPLAFLRIHKCFLVNIAHIATLQHECVTLHNGTQLPIGESRYNESKRRYLLWKG